MDNICVINQGKKLRVFNLFSLYLLCLYKINLPIDFRLEGLLNLNCSIFNRFTCLKTMPH